MNRIVGILAMPPRRGLAWLGLVAVLAAIVGVLELAAGASAQQDSQVATATRGTLTVTVGGVGRMTEASPTVKVYPRAGGQIAQLLATPGQHVVAGQTLAVLDDGGVASAASRQAQSDVATARLELLQKRVTRSADRGAARSDVARSRADLETLLGGSRTQRGRALALAEDNVRLAEKQLERTLAPASAADVAAARAELKRAQADLATLLKPAVSPAPEVLAAAKQAVVVAQQNLAQAKVTGTPAEISAAQLELYRAQAELAQLQRPAPAPLPEEVAAAEAAVASANAKLSKLLQAPNPADVQAARVEVERTKSELRQLRAGPSSVTRGSALQAILSARAKLTQTKSPVDLALARQNVTAAQLRLESARLAERLLVVRAPTAGTVTSVLVAPGATVDPTTVIATVDALDQLVVTVDLSEFDVAQVQRGQTAVIEVDALGGEPYDGSVMFVAPTATDTGGVVTFPVVVGIDDAPQVLRPGMNVSVRIIAARHRNVVQVPLEAVSRDDEDRPFVTILDDSGQEHVQRVKLGIANAERVEIVNGLRAGQNVVLAQQAPEEE